MKILFLILMQIILLYADINSSQKVSITSLIQNFEKIENSFESVDENISKDERINEVLKIKNEKLNKFLSTIKSNSFEFDMKIDEERISFLNQRVEINQKQNNEIAVARDELEIFYTKMNFTFINFLKEFIKNINIYVSAKELNKNIDNFLNTLYSKDIENIKELYSKYENNPSSSQIVSDFIKNYEIYNSRKDALIQITSYLKNNIYTIKKENILIQILNLDYIAKLIDDTTLAKEINLYLEHYLSIKIGRVIIALIVITFILSLRNYFIPLIIAIIEKIAQEKNASFHKYLINSLSGPIKFMLIILAIEIGARVVTIDSKTLELFLSKFQTIYIIAFAWIIYNLLNNAIAYFSDNITTKYPNVRKEMVNFFVTIFKGILLLLILLLILRDFGYDVTTILASLGVGGIAIALAAQSTLSNFFGSLTIILDNSFSQGDWIKTDEVEGTVVELGLRSTTIRTFENALVTIPNSSLANSAIINWSKRKIGRRIKFNIGVTYESNKDNFLNAIREIREYLNKNPKIANDGINLNEIRVNRKLVKKEDLLGVKNSILVYFEEYGDFSINILIYCFSKTTDWKEWLETREEILLKIWDIIEANNLEFAYPTQKLFLENLKGEK